MKTNHVLKYVILSSFLLIIPLNASKKNHTLKKNNKTASLVQKQQTIENINKLVKEGDDSYKTGKAITTTKNSTTTINIFYNATLKFLTAAKQFKSIKKYKESFECYQKAVQALESIDRKNGTPCDLFFDYLIAFELKINTNNMAKKAHIKNYEPYFLRRDAALIKGFYTGKENKKNIKTAWVKMDKIYFTHKKFKKEREYIDLFLEEK